MVGGGFVCILGFARSSLLAFGVVFLFVVVVLFIFFKDQASARMISSKLVGRVRCV